MRRTVRVAIVALTATFLSGCAATAGVLGGGYQREIDQKEADIRELARERDQKLAHLDSTRRQREEVAREESGLIRRLNVLNASLELSRQLLTSERARRVIDRETLEALSAEQVRLDLSLQALQARAKAAMEKAAKNESGSAEVEPELKADIETVEGRVSSHNALLKKYFGTGAH